MNIKFDHTNHKKLWNWLAENPDKEKTDWPEWVYNEGHTHSVTVDCFACDYADEMRGKCGACPLIWPVNSDGQARCDLRGGLWEMWASIRPSKRSKNRVKYALQIANLPVKDGVETI